MAAPTHDGILAIDEALEKLALTNGERWSSLTAQAMVRVQNKRRRNPALPRCLASRGNRPITEGHPLRIILLSICILLPLIYLEPLHADDPTDGSSASKIARPNPLTNPGSPLMLDLAKTGADPTKIDYQSLPRIPSRHVVVSDVRDRSGFWVHQHAYLARYDERYWAMWSDGPGLPSRNVSPEQHRNIVPGHDQPGTRVSYATSEDGLNWSEPKDLSGPPRIKGFGWIARGLWVRDGQLLALASHFNAPSYPGKGLSLEAFHWNKATDVWEAHGTVLDDTLNNFPPKRLPSGKYMTTRRDHRQQVSVIIGGDEAFNQWQIRPMAKYGGKQGRPEEPYWYVLPDGKNIVGLIRDNGGSKRLLRTYSTDNGESWSRIVTTNFPDATSKFFVLRTSRGHYVMVSNSNPRRRDPLTLAISDDGLVFTDLFYLIGGRHVDYPHMIEHNDQLLIAFSGAKQTMEVLNVSIDDIDRLRAQH